MERPPRDFLQDELESHLKQSGCALCRAGARGVASFLESVLYEMVNDPGVREKIVASRGFCNRHIWQLREMRGNALGLAILYRDALAVWQKELDAAAQSSVRSPLAKSRQRLQQATRPRALCLGCQQQAEIESRYTSSFLHALSDAEFQQKFRASAGLCLVHFDQAVRAATGRDALNVLVGIEMEINRQLGGELSEFIRKNDYRFIQEGFGAEGDSWLRAMEHLAGTVRAVGDWQSVPKA